MSVCVTVCVCVCMLNIEIQTASLNSMKISTRIMLDKGKVFNPWCMGSHNRIKSGSAASTVGLDKNLKTLNLDLEGCGPLVLMVRR